MKERYRAALKAFRGFDNERLLRIPVPSLHIVYLPVVRRPEAAEETADRLFAVHDFGLARRLMLAFPEFKGDGPYIVSVLDPLDPNNPGKPKQRYVPQDLSWAPAEFVELWMQVFFDSLNSDFWDYQTLRLLALKLRAYLAIGGEGLDYVEAAAKKLGGVRKALAGSISVVEPHQKNPSPGDVPVRR